MSFGTIVQVLNLFSNPMYVSHKHDFSLALFCLKHTFDGAGHVYKFNPGNLVVALKVSREHVIPVSFGEYSNNL